MLSSDEKVRVLFTVIRCPVFRCFWLRGQHLCHTTQYHAGTPVKTASWWQKNRRHSALHPMAAIDAPAVKKEPTMAAAPQHNLQSTLSGPGQSRHNMDDRSLTQLFVKTGVHRLRCRVITGNTYLVPAFVHLTAESPAPVTTAPGWLPLPCSHTG